MSLFSTTTQNPLGLNPGANERVRVIMRGGNGTKGMVVRFDLAGSDGDVTAGKLAYSVEDSPVVNVLAATNSHAEAGIFAVLDEDILDDKQGWATIRGDVLVAGNGSVTAGLPLCVAASSRLAPAVQHAKILGFAREADGSAGSLFRAFFDGVSGLGHKSSA